MHRKLFCQLGPAAYAVSVAKQCAVRRLQDAAARTPFCGLQAGLLPVVLYRHNSLIRRTLGNTRPELQENKAVNLALAAPKVNGALLRPGQVFSFWHMVGSVTAKKGYREGLTISGGKACSDIGGGLCQMTNLIHWMVLHTPLTVTEHHHHDQLDLFPDYHRQVPFGTGTSVFYNYIDYRVRNDTDMAFQLVVYVTEKYLCGEMRAERPMDAKYHIAAQNECFVRRGGVVYREGEVWRACVDKRTGNTLSRELLRQNHARVMYDESFLPCIKDGQEDGAVTPGKEKE